MCGAHRASLRRIPLPPISWCRDSGCLACPTRLRRRRVVARLPSRCVSKFFRWHPTVLPAPDPAQPPPDARLFRRLPSLEAPTAIGVGRTGALPRSAVRTRDSQDRVSERLDARRSGEHRGISQKTRIAKVTGVQPLPRSLGEGSPRAARNERRRRRGRGPPRRRRGAHEGPPPATVRAIRQRRTCVKGLLFRAAAGTSPPSRTLFRAVR
jgi:hypothetical protein